MRRPKNEGRGSSNASGKVPLELPAGKKFTTEKFYASEDNKKGGKAFLLPYFLRGNSMFFNNDFIATIRSTIDSRRQRQPAS